MFNLFARFSHKSRLLLLVSLTLALGLLSNGQITPVVDASELNKPPAQGLAEWTIMLYQDADDEVVDTSL